MSPPSHQDSFLCVFNRINRNPPRVRITAKSATAFIDQYKLICSFVNNLFLHKRKLELKMLDDNGLYNNLRIAVPADFQNVFCHFYLAVNNSEVPITKTLLPSYQSIVLFNFGTEITLYSDQNVHIRVNKCIVMGPIKKGFDYSLPPDSEILVATFKGDAFYRFFGNASITGTLSLNPDELLGGNCFTELWTDLDKINDAAEKVNYILEYCRPFLRQRNPIAEQIINFKRQNLSPIKSIAKNQNQTERNIQIKHKKYLGYSAKELNRYRRFIRTIKLIQNIVSESKQVDWFQIIDECGYYDQSQLINDFQYYIKLTPKKYLKFQQDICDPIN
ncbi:AraC family transcriptional regulator [Sphingobacterium shayense]|uniref:AraC family transcriptional regulator n=1 Tax=Sphingobacterium shayense TaxID=626343 RepID=UPI001FE76CBD|nr:AraC family transcriptional regulator [Sphingobacterium shayense]